MATDQDSTEVLEVVPVCIQQDVTCLYFNDFIK